MSKPLPCKHFVDLQHIVDDMASFTTTDVSPSCMLPVNAAISANSADIIDLTLSDQLYSCRQPVLPTSAHGMVLIIF